MSHNLADTDGLGTVSYQWLADGQDIVGATSDRLTLAQAQVGKAITVKASYTDLLGTKESVTSSATSSVLNLNHLPTGTVTITGSAYKNQTLTVSHNLADADGLGLVSYQWLANGTPIKNATDSSLTLKQAQVGKVISVEAMYTDLLGTDEMVISLATDKVANIKKLSILSETIQTMTDNDSVHTVNIDHVENDLTTEITLLGAHNVLDYML